MLGLISLQFVFFLGSIAAPQVDLGYSIYEGDDSTGLNVFLGIQYAAPPLGDLRFAAPASPVLNRTSVLPATSYPPFCPQSATGTGTYIPTNNTGASEDCLYLNIWAPPSPSKPLPVLVNIPGGGYKSGNGQINSTGMIKSTGNSFIGVAIQYRLHAFGFLASQDVADHGSLNAGLLDQAKALQWVQQYIHLFGGDPRQVTIAGNSAGGGSVMLHNMAFGGTLGTQWFKNSIATSPYLPKQFCYRDEQPSRAYKTFLSNAGCANQTTALLRMSCLRNATSEDLMAAADRAAQSGVYAEALFAPVTDFTYIQDVPSKQLLDQKVNGEFALLSNNANEGPDFTPQNITTEAIFETWIRTTWPFLTDEDLRTLQNIYSSDKSIQQRADNVYAEATFVCPSYWLDEAFPDRSWRYQFSVPPATHGLDSIVAFISPTPYSADLVVAFEAAWTNFVIKSSPVFSSLIANGNSTGNTTFNPVSTWPVYDPVTPLQVDFNNTCDAKVPGIGICRGNNTLSLVDANTWAHQRYTRCAFWRSVAPRIPA